MSFWWLALLCPAAYFIGNISPSVLISKFALKSDVRADGSGNAGATNMMRKFGFRWALLILVLDMLKSAVPALVGLLLYGGFSYNGNPLMPVASTSAQIAMYACGFAALLGHVYPVLMKFRGGKGVATAVGVFAVANPVIGLSALVFGLLHGAYYQYASVSSFLFITWVVLWEGILKSPHPAVCGLLIGYYFFVLFTHRQNIVRILTGRERRANMFAKLRRKKKNISNSS